MFNLFPPEIRLSFKFIGILLREQCRLSASVLEQDRLVRLGKSGADQIDHPCRSAPGALITRGFGEHTAAMEDVAGVLSKNERLTLLRLLKKLGEYAAETHG